MKFARKLLLGSVATAAMLAANPALAQSNDAEMEALRAEVAALKAQLAELSAKVEKVAASHAPASSPVPVVVVDDEKKAAAEISWKGAPEMVAAPSPFQSDDSAKCPPQAIRTWV